MAVEDPPGFVVRTEVQKAAWDNGYRVGRGLEAGWLRYTSTTAPGDIWLGGASAQGPWFLSVAHSGVAEELARIRNSEVAGPGRATLLLATLSELHDAVDRVYKLSVSLPTAPLDRFRAKTAGLPRSTEAERLVVQRIGQDIFREALLDYWDHRCPLTGITEPELLRASHIKPWAECTDEERLDVHNGLLLSALWDAAFDKGLVSFADDGTPLAGARLGVDARRALGFDGARVLPDLRAAHCANLSAHRRRFGFSGGGGRGEAP